MGMSAAVYAAAAVPGAPAAYPGGAVSGISGGKYLTGRSGAAQIYGQFSSLAVSAGELKASGASNDSAIKNIELSKTPVAVSPLPASPINASGPSDSAAFTRHETDYARTDPKYFTLNPASIQVTRLAEAEEDFSYLNGVRTDLGVVQVLLDQVINIGAKLWDIIKQNAPVVNVSTSYAVAVPQGITEWNQLSGWKKPKSYTYVFSARNFYGAKVVDVRYKVIFTYGGAYKGKGQYLTGVTMIPSTTNVSWGYRFSLAAKVPDSTIVNTGTDSDPVAAMQLNAVWQIATTLKENNGTSVYYIQGDGYFEEL